jgi:hypothetical protein
VQSQWFSTQSGLKQRAKQLRMSQAVTLSSKYIEKLPLNYATGLGDIRW